MLDNQSLFEDQRDQIPTQMGFFSFTQSLNSPALGCHQATLKAFAALNPCLASDAHSTAAPTLCKTLLGSATPKPGDITCSFEGQQLLALQRNRWAWGDVNECLGSKRSTGGDDHYLGVSAMKMKKMKSRRKVREPRFCFKTMSDVDVLDDGYKWRKYGQKVVKNTQHPRSYYRCTRDNCRVKKRVERLAEDPRMVITTYEGRHAHSPSNDLEDSQTDPSQLDNFLF